jgi:UDP-glucose 4-epimerase
MNKITNKTVLITGGAGNIGSYILDLVMNNNPKECIIIDNFFNSDKEYIKKYLNQQNFVIYPIDISSLEELQFVFEKHKIDYIFHCASMLIQDSEKLPRKSINTNILGTFNIVDLANKYNIKKICYSSSASVYGEPKTLPVEEIHPYQYKNFIYGWTKIAAEMIFLSNCKCDWVGFRYYNVYSERMRQGAFYTQVFPIFYNHIINKTPVKIYGDGKQTMDLIYAGDIAKANILGLESDITNEFFNVGTGIETSASDLAQMIMNELDIEVPIEFIPNDTQKVKNRKSGTKKILNLLNFTPETTVLEGVKKYVNYQKLK